MVGGSQGEDMDGAKFQECDLTALLWVIDQISTDGCRFPARHKSRRDHDILAGLVVSEEIKRVLGSDPSAVVEALKAKGIRLKPAQVRNYFLGRFTPGADVVGRIANAFALPEIRLLFKMPWRLLTDEALGLSEVKKTRALRSDVVLRRLLVGTKSAKRTSQTSTVVDCFSPAENCLNAPGHPEEFWQPLAAFRAALALRDWHAVNAHYWSVIANLPSLALRPAVISHVELLFSRVRILTRGINPQFLWFSVNWDTVRETIETRDFGPTCRFKPFRNVFSGTEMHLGRPFPISEEHRYLERHYPKVAAELRLFGRGSRGLFE